MYIVQIAWLYIILMISLTENSVIAGVLTFAFFGLGPSVLLWWMSGSRIRRQRRKAASSVAEQVADQANRADTQTHEDNLH